MWFTTLLHTVLLVTAYNRDDFSGKDVLTLHQQGCSVYVFDFEQEFPDLGRGLAPKAANPRCSLAGVVNMGGPFFKRKVVIKDPLASMHLPRGLQPARLGQHAGPWWLARALRLSAVNLVPRAEDADVIYVDDFCYNAWSEAKMHNHAQWHADEDLYVDPDTYLAAAYDALTRHPAFTKRNGTNFVFFHSHPMIRALGLLCAPVFGHSLHLVTEANVRSSCRAEGTATPARPIVMPYASFPVYPVPDSVPARPTLFYMRATCQGWGPGKALRKAIVDKLKDTPNATLSCEALGWEDSLLHEMAEARFCLIVAGDTPSSRRLTEAVLAGCVPVFLGPPFHALPLAGVLRYDAFSVFFGFDHTEAWTGGKGPMPDDLMRPLGGSLAPRLPSLDALPGALKRVGRVQYAQLSYHLALVRPAFSYLWEPQVPAGQPAGLCDVAYSQMCHHVAAKREGLS